MESGVLLLFSQCSVNVSDMSMFSSVNFVHCLSLASVEILLVFSNLTRQSHLSFSFSKGYTLSLSDVVPMNNCEKLWPHDYLAVGKICYMKLFAFV